MNFYCFDLIALKSHIVSAWNLVCGRFINLKKGRKNLTFLTFLALVVEHPVSRGKSIYKNSLITIKAQVFMWFIFRITSKNFEIKLC